MWRTPQDQQRRRDVADASTTATTAVTSFVGWASAEAPALHVQMLTERQRAGGSCCWCAGVPDHRFPVRIVRTAAITAAESKGAARSPGGTPCAAPAHTTVRLYACVLCASMYGVPEAAR